MSDEAGRFHLRAISLGAGLQSSWMHIEAARGRYGVIPDVSIFADTKNEPPWVYRQLDRLEAEFGDVIPIHRVSAGDLGDDYFTGQVSRRGPEHENAIPAQIPFHVKNPDGSKGFMGRGCSDRYKIDPIQKEIRRILGLKKGQRWGDIRVEQWIGISLDEVQRVKTSGNVWNTLRYPLVFDVPMRRGEIAYAYEQEGREAPGRSACWFCPFRSNSEWISIRNSPELWSKAVAFDKRLRVDGRFRNSRATGHLDGEMYLHASLKPLDEVELDADDGQLDMFQNECGGGCGV